MTVKLAFVRDPATTVIFTGALVVRLSATPLHTHESRDPKLGVVLDLDRHHPGQRCEAATAAAG